MIWKCTLCGRRVQSQNKPNARFELVSSVHLGGNLYQGVTNTDASKAANHYGAVCFGPERGEDYQEHNWKKVNGNRHGISSGN